MRAGRKHDAMVADLEYELGTELREVSALGRFVAAWSVRAHLSAREMLHLQIALDELVTNVIRHGFGEGRPGRIRVCIVRHRDSVTLELRDNAPPFDPFQVPPPDLQSDIDLRPVGGLGVHMVRNFVEWGT